MKNWLVLFLVGLSFFNCEIVLSQSKKISKISVATPVKDSLKSPLLKQFPVVLAKDTLFFISNKIGSFSAQNRAEAISSRLKKLSEDTFFEEDSLSISPSDFSFDILYKKDFYIMSITDADAKDLESSSKELSQKYLALFKSKILFDRRNNSDFNKLKRVGLELVLIFAVLLILFFINVLFRKLKYFLITKAELYFKGFKINNFKILTPNNQLLIFLKLLGLLRILVLIFVVYLSLPLLFSVFPTTEGYTTTLLNWILKPAKSLFIGFVGFLPNLFSIIVIVFLFHYAVKIIKYFVGEIEKGNIHIDGFYSDWAKPTFNIIRVLMYAFMLVIIFPYLPGSDSSIFKGVTVFVGVLFSIGSSNAIANMVAGLVITYMRPFKIGDFVKIGDVKGEVIEKTALVTRIRTPKMEDITIPNATVLSSSSINFSSNTSKSENGLLIHTTVTIGYDVPWRKVHQALINAALKTDLLEKEPSPFVLQTSLDDFFVSYEINAFTQAATKQPLVYSILHQNIQDSFFEDGIEIMSPHYNALRDGNTTTIPKNL